MISRSNSVLKYFLTLFTESDSVHFRGGHFTFGVKWDLFNGDMDMCNIDVDWELEWATGFIRSDFQLIQIRDPESEIIDASRIWTNKT